MASNNRVLLEDELDPGPVYVRGKDRISNMANIYHITNSITFVLGLAAFTLGISSFTAASSLVFLIWETRFFHKTR